jgi:hypothetical protein
MLSVQTAHECVPRHFTLYATTHSFFCPSTHMITRVCHFQQTNIALLTVIQGACCFFSFKELTRQRLCLPLEGQCCDCLTSSRLSWDEDGVGLPRDTPLTVTLALWLCITKSCTRTSRNFCVSCSHHRTYGLKKAFSMVMSVRWKNNILVHFHGLRAIP